MAPNIDKAYQWAVNTCNAPDVRYSMNYYLREGKTDGLYTYYDCSSFIYYALIAGGFPLQSGAAFTTRDMIPVLLNLGFTEISPTGTWTPGDVLWRPGHTEMVYLGGPGQGRTMGAHTDDYPGPDQVSIYPQTSYASEWVRMFRYGNGASGGYGSDIAIISAICANFKRMSNVNPSQWEGGVVGRWSDVDKGYGLGQWENTSAVPAYGYVPPMEWVYSYYIGSSTGNTIYSVGHKYAMTEIFQVGEGDIIVNDTPTTVDGYRYISEFVFYKTTTTLNDTYMYTRSVTGTPTFTVPTDCTGMRIQIGRRSADPVILEPTDCEDNVNVKIRSKNRLNNMYRWFTEQGKQMDDGDAQIDYFQNESFWLTTGTGAAWANDYPSLKTFMGDTQQDDLDILTEVFFNCWRSLSSTTDAAELAATKQEAADLFRYLSLNYNEDAEWTSRVSGITNEEALHNVIMIFNSLSAGIGGGGNKPPDTNMLNISVYKLFRKRKYVIFEKE